jgi:hypothetical protein
MRTAKEIYKDKIDADWFYIDNYNPMIKEFGDVLVQVDDDDYQGDTRVLYQRDGKIGYLNFGWGSCSGCDALQDCGDIGEVQELMNGLYNHIKWFDDKKQALEWFNTHDWEGDYTWHADEQQEFINECKKVLSV